MTFLFQHLEHSYLVSSLFYIAHLKTASTADQIAEQNRTKLTIPMVKMG